MKHTRVKAFACRVWAAMAIVLIAGSTALAQPAIHNATVYLRNGSQASGKVRWLGASKVYEVAVPSKGTRQYSLNDVAEIRLAKPPELLAQASAAVQRGQHAQAIPVLKKIKDAYKMFGPDLEATRWLAVAHLKLNQIDEAVKMCEEVVRENPQAQMSGGFASVYWDALVKKKDFGKLRRILGDAVETGGREVAAIAQVRRGDMDKEKGELKKALLDGYLRTILMFQDVKSIQPEALYKAVKCHEALNEHSHAEKWRKQLMSAYPKSEYAAMLK